MSARVLRIRSDDDVALALDDLAAGEPLGVGGVHVIEAVPRGHKVALRTIPKGSLVRKYGHAIGRAAAEIAAGAHVHVHNLAFEPLASMPTTVAPPKGNGPGTMPQCSNASFLGFRRDSGRPGTRNYIGILTSVNCAATVARQIARRFGDGRPPATTSVDGVVALTHSSGCGMAAAGEGIDLLRRTLAGYARHPNFGGVLLIGLGCEVNQIETLLAHAGLSAGPRLRILGIQESGGTSRAIDSGVAIVSELIAIADRDRRVSLPVCGLALALQCGGSDSWSGLTANPALGVAADLLVAAGGSVVLSETPEIYGAEDLLLARAIAPEIADRLRARLRWWERYVERHGTDLNNNPSPGNIAGGISTILEKALGAVAKGGTSPLVDVLEYAEAIRRDGFQFMDSPGYDPCSATGQIAAGCNVMAFTTGRGAVFGAKPVPSIKLASNAGVARHMSDDIDIDCSAILDGGSDVPTIGRAIFDRLLALASGEASASERLGYGDAEFVPWLIGAVV